MTDTTFHDFGLAVSTLGIISSLFPRTISIYFYFIKYYLY